MAKRIALKDSIKVDTTDLSSFARTVTFDSEHDRVDVSGFNATGTQEFLAGQTTQTVSVEFYNGYAAGEPHTILYPIHKNRTIVAFAWRADQTAVASATNPELRGNVQLLHYNPSATRGDAETWTAEFTTADAAGLQFFTTWMEGTLRVSGYRELMRGLKQCEREERLAVRHTLRDVGAIVQRDAARRIAPKSAKTAGGYKVRVRQRDVAVEQSLKKTTGQHGQWGSYQMRHALLPALYENQAELKLALEQALDKISDHFNRGGPLSMQIQIAAVAPYDGRYQLDFGQEFTTREWGWIKRLSGYLPLNLDEAAAGGDPEFACALAVIALYRAGKLTAQEVPGAFERLSDAPFGSALTIELEPADEAEEDDAGPPPRSSNGSEPISGGASPTNSETLPPSPTRSGTPGSATAGSESKTWVS